MNLHATAYAAEPTPEFAITDDVVIIQHVPYKIFSNTIQYDGKTYEIKGSVLVTYDEEGPIYLILPVEQNKVTDPKEIARLNATIGQPNLSTHNTSSVLDLPYSAEVPAGTRTLTTPNFNIISGQYSYVTALKLSGFTLFADRRFNVTFSYNNVIGEWTTVDLGEVDFLFRNPLRLQNFTSMQYGHFVLESLCPNTPPAYTYEVYKTNAS